MYNRKYNKMEDIFAKLTQTLLKQLLAYKEKTEKRESERQL